jgi:hypothetical protein|tara:strand:- start:698 stop:1786 length:1089 start_codon:yes stop_codon:yes gene_type:complete
MVYKYVSKNKYFKDVIDDYFKTDWTKYNDINLDALNYVDVDYPNKSCNKCNIINQFKTVDMLSNKKEQYNNIIKYNNGVKPDYIPLTISFTKDTIKNIEYLFTTNKKWILKPENSLARKGVCVINSYSDCHNHIMSLKYNTWIIQDYIDNPLLISGKKFHFRVYSLVIKDNTSITVLLYNKGFMYSSKMAYDNNLLLNEIHLSGEDTPDSVNIFPEHFNKHIGGDIYNTQILPQFKRIVRDTVLSVYDRIQCPDGMSPKYKCFKMFGYDFVVDSSYKLHLAEINARLISFKYPPPGFKQAFYKNILDIITLPNIDPDNIKGDFLYIDTRAIIHEKKRFNKSKLYAAIYAVICLLLVIYVILT